MSQDTNFGLWAVAESPLTIEYSLVVLEEIRHAVTEGFQRLSRGGIEVGGGEPGVREMYQPTYYAAFVLDADGNNVEAVCHAPA